jgi:hypothetical protein
MTMSNVELPISNSIYPGCLVMINDKSSYYSGRVIVIEKHPRDVKTSDATRSLPIPEGSIGVAIEIFPNALVRKSERTWLVYFHPKMTVVEQSRLRRVSFSWKETHK